MQPYIEHTGIADVDLALSFLRDKSGQRIGRSSAVKMASVYASGARKFIPKSIRPESRDKGIGYRGVLAREKNTFTAKAGIAVGPAKRNALKTVNRGKRKGVGVSANNLHWFALGTQDRYTGMKKSGKGVKKTGHKRRFTGRINKEDWGGFIEKGVQANELVAIEVARKNAQRMIEEEAAKAKR